MFNASLNVSFEENSNSTQEIFYFDATNATNLTFEGSQLLDIEDDPQDIDILPDLANTYLPPYPNPSRNPSVFQNASNSSTFEILFQFSPTFTNLLILFSLVLCTVWVIVMNMMIIGALLKGHRNEKEHVTDMYLINLLFADVLLGLFVFPFMSIVILIGYFPFAPTWCNIWVYFDYYLIIASSYGFAALMCSYLMILRWPQYYPKSRRLHFVWIVFIWVLANGPWVAPFINDRVSIYYPKGFCGFSIKKNKYFTIYIGFTGFYIPLAISLTAGIFTVKYLKQSARVPVLKVQLRNDDKSAQSSVVPTSADSIDSPEFNNLYQSRRHPRGMNQVHFNPVKLRPGLSPSELPTDSTTEGSDSLKPNKRYSMISVKTFQRNKALQDSVKKHFPLVATSLILFVLSRSPFYTYFGVGSVVPKLFPPDLSHSVYWAMHSYAVAAPVVHLLLDRDLRRSVTRFINEGTFELPPYPDATTSKAIAPTHSKGHNREVAVSTVTQIDGTRHSQHHHNHPRHQKPYMNGNAVAMAATPQQFRSHLPNGHCS